MKFKFVLPVLICSTLLIGCKNQQEVEAKNKGVEELTNIENRWADAYTLASSTSRIALATPVSQLQEIKRDLLTTEVSECLKPATEALSSYMNMHINNFLYFMANENVSPSDSNPKLVEYFAIKTKCVGDTNSNPNLLAEAMAIDVSEKAKAERLAQWEKDFNKPNTEKGISLEAAKAELEADLAAN
ncbi:TPA: hypothetical protein R8G29_005003 [Citrobacter freundii]|nr:hypothetical protein [Citrobacter freundii]